MMDGFVLLQNLAIALLIIPLTWYIANYTNTKFPLFWTVASLFWSIYSLFWPILAVPILSPLVGLIPLYMWMFVAYRFRN